MRRASGQTLSVARRRASAETPAGMRALGGWSARRCPRASWAMLEGFLVAQNARPRDRDASGHHRRISEPLPHVRGGLPRTPGVPRAPSMARRAKPDVPETPVFSTPSLAVNPLYATIRSPPVDVHRRERRGARRFLASPSGLKGELTSPAFERSQRVGKGGPRQHPLSLADGGGRIDARPEKAARAIERAPRVGSTDAPPWSAPRGPESTQHARDRR
jgi:hypothetical protein